MVAKPNCVILDDEEYALAFLKNNIEELNLLNIERAFLDPDELLVEFDNLKSDIYFLDIEMAISGIEVAEKLKDKLVIFVSGRKDLAFETYDVRAIDFVPKPIRKSRLKEAIERALLALKNRQSDFIVLKTDTSTKEEIKQEDIIYMKAVGRDKEIYFSNGKSTIAKNINWDTIQSELSDNFLQINPQNTVNIKYATKLISADLIGVNYNGKTIELSLTDKFKESFFKAKPHLK
ncbi:LytR/AlgR family response regulator transcription factor [Lutibacter sp.]|uniref:LytR/AlgR family response regulator transcription factor n=1 Tax=Lutibacter sp. TaxID=1925666 RepID=UPI003563139F